MMLGAKAPDLDVCRFFRTTGSTGKYFKENKNSRRRAANSEAPAAVFLFMTIECSQSVHSIVS